MGAHTAAKVTKKHANAKISEYSDVYCSDHLDAQLNDTKLSFDIRQCADDVAAKNANNDQKAVFQKGKLTVTAEFHQYYADDGGGYPHHYLTISGTATPDSYRDGKNITAVSTAWLDASNRLLTDGQFTTQERNAMDAAAATLIQVLGDHKLNDTEAANVISQLNHVASGAVKTGYCKK